MKAYQFCFLNACAQVPNRMRLHNIGDISGGNGTKTSLSLPPLNKSPAAQSHSQDREWYTNASTYSQGRRIISDISALCLRSRWSCGGYRGCSSAGTHGRGTDYGTAKDVFTLKLIVLDGEEGRIASLAFVADVAVSTPELCWSFVSTAWAGPDISPHMG